jgi:septum formation protein
LIKKSRQGDIKVYTSAVKTKVWIRKLTQLEIESYVNSGEPMDKAGAYAAQGRGLTLIERVEGSYSNVVGLPVVEVINAIRMIQGFGK